MTAKKVTKVTKAKNWKKATKPEELELPSGNVCLVRRPDPLDMLYNGSIPDALSPMVQRSIDKNSGSIAEEDLVDLVLDKGKQRQIVEFMDHLVVKTVIEPTILPNPAQEEDRDPDSLYADEVSGEDKQFIMQFAMGGTRSVERFRRELAGTVDSVADLVTDENNPS